MELSVFVHYNEILRFRRGKMYGLLTMYAIFVDGFEMQALNHVCILHFIWSWVRPQGPYLHPHAKKYLYHPPFCMQVYFLHISLHQKRAIECVLIIQKHTPNIHVMIQCIIW